MGLKHDFVWQDIRAINPGFYDFPGLWAPLSASGAAVQLQSCHHWLRGYTWGRVDIPRWIPFVLVLFAPQLQSSLLGKAEMTSFLLSVITDLQHLGEATENNSSREDSAREEPNQATTFKHFSYKNLFSFLQRERQFQSHLACTRLTIKAPSQAQTQLPAEKTFKETG